MKRTIAMCLVTMLMLSLALAVYGDELPSGGSTTITYTVEETYVVSIPEKVDISKGFIDVSMSECHLNYPVYLYINSSNYGSTGWKLVKPNSMSSVKYNITDINNNTVFPGCLGEMAANTTIHLNISLVDNGTLASLPAGTYTDTLTFTFRDSANY